MKLESFALADENAVRQWLATERFGTAGTLSVAGDWSPLDPGAEGDVTELITSARQHGHLVGPGQIGLLYSEEVDDDWFKVTVGLPRPDEGWLWLCADAASWARINPSGEAGVDAAMAVLGEVISIANGLLQTLEAFVAPCESAAYEQALTDSLEVADGIEAHEVCTCGEPIAFFEGSWLHVYNDRLRGTDDHSPSPN